MWLALCLQTLDRTVQQSLLLPTAATVVIRAMVVNTHTHTHTHIPLNGSTEVPIIHISGPGEEDHSTIPKHTMQEELGSRIIARGLRGL